MANFLYFIANHIDPEAREKDGEVQFEIPLKRADMADFLGLTIETVSRQLTKLRQAQVIDLPNNRTVVVRNFNRLRNAAEGPAG